MVADARNWVHLDAVRRERLTESSVDVELVACEALLAEGWIGLVGYETGDCFLAQSCPLVKGVACLAEDTDLLGEVVDQTERVFGQTLLVIEGEHIEGTLLDGARVAELEVPNADEIGIQHII